MKLKEFVKFLIIDNIYDKKVPKDYLSDFIDYQSSNEDYIIVTIRNDQNVMENKNYKIEFDTYISWEIFGDIENNINEVEIEIDLINIEDYLTGDVINLDDEDSINKIMKWVESIISEN